MNTTYLYAVIRKDLSGGALLAQYGHAITECLKPSDLPLPTDTRIVVLGATKDQLTTLRQRLCEANVPHREIIETDGVLAGSVTAIGLHTTDRDSLRPILGEFRPFRFPPTAPMDLLEEAMALITNASGGDWNLQAMTWKLAAEDFRKKFDALRKARS